jgi:hypothetical protein
LLVSALFLYIVVNKNIDKYAEGPPWIARLIVAVAGLIVGVGCTMFLLDTIKDPGGFFGLGFVFGPFGILLGLVSLVVALFLPPRSVSGFLRILFKPRKGSAS